MSVTENYSRILISYLNKIALNMEFYAKQYHVLEMGGKVKRAHDKGKDGN